MPAPRESISAPKLFFESEEQSKAHDVFCHAQATGEAQDVRLGQTEVSSQHDKAYIAAAAVAEVEVLQCPE